VLAISTTPVDIVTSATTSHQRRSTPLPCSVVSPGAFQGLPLHGRTELHFLQVGQLRRSPVALPRGRCGRLMREYPLNGH